MVHDGLLGRRFLRRRRRAAVVARCAACCTLLPLRQLHASQHTHIPLKNNQTKLSVDGSEESSKLTAAEREERKKAKKEAKERERAAKEAAQAQRGVKQAAITQPEEGDPLADKYGDPPMVQSTEQTGRTWTSVEALSPAMAGQTVLVRARVHTTRGKGKSAFLVLRQRTGTVQAVMFADGEIVSKGMVKYACGIPKESIVDVEGVVAAAAEPIEGCSQKDVSVGAVCFLVFVFGLVCVCGGG
jgi:aspartyl-tRNA synthetase